MSDQRDWPIGGQPYVGPERRTDRIALSAALEDVRGTKGSVERLIDQLSPVATAKQLGDIRKMFVLLFAAQMVSSVVFVVFLVFQINRGHREIASELRVTQCLETQPEVAKIADPTKAVATCRQAEVRP